MRLFHSFIDGLAHFQNELAAYMAGLTFDLGVDGLFEMLTYQQSMLRSLISRRLALEPQLRV